MMPSSSGKKSTGQSAAGSERAGGAMDRRAFLKMSAVTTGAIWLGAPALLAKTATTKAGSVAVDLAGPWEFSPADQDAWMPASVPGCVQTDLLAAGKIADPFYRDNEQAVQWVGQNDWRYRRSFQVPAELLRQDRVWLRCEGLDTLAEIQLNGQPVGQTDNMFRTWEFEVKALLKPGVNQIQIAFASPFPLMVRSVAERPLYEWIGSHEPSGRAYVRKEPCSFGWDWGPVLVTAGIWRGLGLHAFSQGRLTDLLVLQEHSPAGSVRLEAALTAELIRPGNYHAVVTVRLAGQTVDTATVSLTAGQGRATFDLSQPQLWWPAGMGAQPLYEITAELFNADQVTLGRLTRRVGLRVLKALPPEGSLPLRFEVNGIAFFAKGANLIPLDAFPNRVTPEKLRQYVLDAVAVNMNSLRFWGGGYYEEDALFEACDELGICVWLDFKFACSSYPAFDANFMANVRAEARDQLRRLRHHACIALWCGNNEISLMTKEQWSDESMGREDYDRLFRDLLGQQVRELAPQANYVTGSPDCGDVHYWQVWHGGKSFEIYRTVSGFMSEFGFQSFPDPKTVRAFTVATDRNSLLSPVMKWHQRSHNDGNEKILAMIQQYFKAPKDFESTLWLSQILQGYGIKIGAESWRQSMPKSMGCIFWQYNDCWPVASWSSVDYYGRWKALHYLARRFYAPVLVSGLENTDQGTIDVFVTSDRLTAAHGELRWEVTDLAGQTLLQGDSELELPARTSRLVKSLELQALIEKHQANNLLTWLQVVVAGQVVSENLVMLARPKEMKLTDPRLSIQVVAEGAGHKVTLQAQSPALWAWLSFDELDARFSDNFVHLKAGAPATILVQPQTPMDSRQVRERLRVRSLFDLCV